MIKKFKRAFTIVELVIVIAVVGILASVLIPTFSNIIKNATVSADTQHVTSMNIQLAASLNDITTEEELKQQIDIVFEGNHFDDFAPQSAKYGYHYWYDIANKKIVLATSSELSATPVNNTESGIGGFGISTYAASTSKEFKGFEFRYFFNRGYYLLDRAGSDVAEALDRLTDLNEEKYLQVVQLLFKAESSGYDMDLATVLKEKVATTAIITDNGTFRFNRNNVNNVLFVEGIETVAAELYVYNEATETIEKGFSSVERPIAHASEINLPASVETVESNAMFFADNSAVINMAQGKDSTEIFDAKSTNATIKNANGQTCEMGSNYTTTVTSFDVELKDGENDKIKVNSNFVYVAYDMGNFYLKATNFNEDASSQ